MWLSLNVLALVCVVTHVTADYTISDATSAAQLNTDATARLESLSIVLQGSTLPRFTFRHLEEITGSMTIIVVSSALALPR